MGLSTLPVISELEVLASALRQEKELQGRKIGKKKRITPTYKQHDCLLGRP